LQFATDGGGTMLQLAPKSPLRSSGPGLLFKAYRSFVVASTTMLVFTLGPIGVHVPVPAIVKPAVHNAKIQTLIVPSRPHTRRRTSILLFNFMQRPSMESVVASELGSFYVRGISA
jgi:hypothetical protein